MRVLAVERCIFKSGVGVQEDDKEEMNGAEDHTSGEQRPAQQERGEAGCSGSKYSEDLCHGVTSPL